MPFYHKLGEIPHKRHTQFLKQNGRLNQIIDINDAPGGGSIVIGTIVHIHAEEKVMLAQDKIDIMALKPIGRLMGGGFCRVTDLIELERPKNIIRGES